MWLRITGLPIEYYSQSILKIIDDRIGETMKMDKTTTEGERGKYARVYVKVNLSKPLLAMFSIKGRLYKIEYKGLHLLCLASGKFGYYKEGYRKVKIRSSGV